MKKNSVFKFFLALYISWFVAIIAADRSDQPKEYNDTSGYAMHYNCLSSGQGIDSCGPIISASTVEFVYQYIASLCSSIFNFYVFKFLLAFAISFAMTWSVIMLSPGIILPMIMLMVDFRFWEYSSNVLRHGLASSIFLIGFAVYIKYRKRIAFYIRYLALGAHIGAVFLFFASTRRVSRYTLIFTICFAALLINTSQFWIPLIMDSGFSVGKLGYYLFYSKDYNFALPLHYFFIILIGFFLYGRIDNKGYTASYNMLIILVAATIMLARLDLSYRVISLMLPFVIICASHQIRYISSMLKPCANSAYLALSLVYLSFFVLAFVRNIDAFIIHLS